MRQAQYAETSGWGLRVYG